jgi:hypothetical protein
VKLQFKKRRFLPAALAILVLVVGSGVAYAYWTAGGSGTGNADAAAGTVAVQAYMTSTIEPMYPGDSAQPISGDFLNTNSGPVYVSTVTVSFALIDPVTVDGVVVSGCTTTDFTLANAIATVNTQIVASPDGTAHTGSWGGGALGPTIHFNNKDAPQDACKRAIVHLAFAVV